MLIRVYRLAAIFLIFSLAAPSFAVAGEASSSTLFTRQGDSLAHSNFEGFDLSTAIRSSDGRVRVIIELDDPPLASNLQGMVSAPGTSRQPLGGDRLDVGNPFNQAYLSRLNRAQDNLVSRLAILDPGARAERRYQVAFNGIAVEVHPAHFENLVHIPGVKAIYPDQVRTIQLNESVDLINAPALWEDLDGQSNAGAGVFVAVIDTGLRPEHPMFSGDGFDMPAGFPKGFCAENDGDEDFQCNNKVVAARYYEPTFPIPDKEVLKPLDVSGHGTHVAGIAAGNPVTILEDTEISGVAPGAYLMVYKALFLINSDSSAAVGSDSMLLAALDDAVKDGAQVINNSWGGGVGMHPDQSPFKTAIETITQAGVVVVFAAGNSGPNPGTILCPGCVEEAITVAASNKQDVLASFSSTGPNGDWDVLKPDITAPGVSILSAHYPSEYNWLSGTSMAAPHVSGSAALLLQLHPGWTPTQIKTALTSTAQQSMWKPDEMTPADPFNMGAGRVDLERARRAALTFDRPSFANGNCSATCAWFGVMRSEVDAGVTWQASAQVTGGLEVKIEPQQVSLAPGAAAAFQVQATTAGLEANRWYFAVIVWSDVSGVHPEAHLPLAVYVTNFIYLPILMQGAAFP